jgi:ribosome-associated toxin RatA of RatAB toxin-antitoxin module
MTSLLKGAVALLCLPFLVLGLGLVLSPSAMEAQFGLHPDGLVGWGTLRGNLGGLFLGTVSMLGLGLWRRNTTFFLAAASLLGMVALGRMVGFALDGVQMDSVAPLFIELVAVAVLLAATVNLDAAANGGLQSASASRLIHAPLARVWPIAADVTAVTNWHPAVANADLLSALPTGLGATRRCHFHDGTNVREEVVEVDEDRRVRLRITEFSAPLRRLEVEITFARTSTDQTQASFALHYEVKGGVFGQLLGATLLRREMTKVASRALAGLGHFAATGETVTKDFVPAPSEPAVARLA